MSYDLMKIKLSEKPVKEKKVYRIKRTPIKKKKATPLPKLQKKSQLVVNERVRTRDKDKGCISCNGEVQQAGHYFSAGHFTALRYDETNIHGQCIRCNCFLHGNLIQYRIGLVKRYGEDYVKELESKSELRKTHKWQRQELEEIIKG